MVEKRRLTFTMNRETEALTRQAAAEAGIFSYDSAGAGQNNARTITKLEYNDLKAIADMYRYCFPVDWLEQIPDDHEVYLETWKKR